MCLGMGMYSDRIWKKKNLNRPHPALNYLNQAVYPFYILHQTVIVILAYYVVRAPDEVGMKYVFTVLVTLGITMMIYHYFIRPFKVMRILFGGKKQRTFSK